MFRNPRENRALPGSSQLAPSAGRPPSPPCLDEYTPMVTTGMMNKVPPKPKASGALPKTTQTTLVSTQWGKKSPANNGKNKKPPPATNGNIMAFFKKAEDINNRIFLQERGSNPTLVLDEVEEDVGWSDEMGDGVTGTDKGEERYNEHSGSIKKRKINEKIAMSTSSPPTPEAEAVATLATPTPEAPAQAPKSRKKPGPFVDDSESEDDKARLVPPRRGTIKLHLSEESSNSKSLEESLPAHDPETSINHTPPLLKTEEKSQLDGEAFEDYEGLEDDGLLEGEEYDERRWIKEQRKLEMEDADFEGDSADFDAPPLFPEDGTSTNQYQKEGCSEETPSCPICTSSLKALTEQEASMHVNACLDGNPIPLPKPKSAKQESTPTSMRNAKVFQRPPRPAKPAQANPFQLGEPSTQPKSAFSKLMAGHVEDAAWATAAADQNASRGKPAFERTCPFYKIMPGFFICVDAFRYGAVKSQNAYFLSHFHSDHYIGLTSTWSHGPIYCSKVTANLVRQQLRVDSKWVVDLDFEKKTEIPETEGVHVTMISANHCPGSSLFLFEKETGKGTNVRLQRVLHCGDFRACQAHIEHPLLRPDVLDAVSGKNRQQKLDACYLDTTYLNPKYAFPPQQQVIQACADMCVSLNKARPDDKDD